MCIICVQWEKGLLTSEEALRNLGELMSVGTESEEHYLQVVSDILDKEVPVRNSDAELDKAWSKEVDIYGGDSDDQE